jgi:hypothetical protein
VRTFTGPAAAGRRRLFDEFVARGLDVERVPGLGAASRSLGDLRALAALRRELARSRPTSCTRTPARPARSAGARRPRAARGARAHLPRARARGVLPGAVSRALVALEARSRARPTASWPCRTRRPTTSCASGSSPTTRLVVVPPGIDLEPFLASQRRDGALRG